MKKDLTIPFRWEERRHIFLEKFLYVPKKYDSKLHGSAVDWACLFGNDLPIAMEFCSGNGQWILEKAKQHREYNWVAVEMQFCRARQIWRKLQNENLSNVYVVCCEGLEFLNYYVSPKSISQSFVNFPDPWPKRSHAKHRIIQRPFVTRLKEVLDPNGLVTLTTDSFAYRDQMLEEFAQWPSTFQPPFFCTNGYGKSFFADLWRGKGREIFTLQYANDLD